MFTIGELVGATAILLAFSQFFRPVTLLRLYSGWLKPKAALSWLFLSLH